MSILSFFRNSAPSAPFTGDDAARMKLYKKLRFQSFIAGTVGYSLYYVCRTSLNVVKKPILESGALDATQLGIIGSALLFAYAIGKFVNGFLSDHSNIKRFMAAGLCVSAVANLLVGALGFANGGGMVGNMTLFIVFAEMWGVNGWSQSMGAPPAIIALSRYAINGWGVLFLQEVKGYSLATATQVISVNALLGIVGTVFSGWLSDTLFHGRRNVLAFGFGVLNTVALCLFLYSGDSMFVNLLSMVLFGMAIGVLICFLGGLMAIDIVPREATGAALGIVGMASYVGAGLQDIVSGWLINSGKTVTDGVTSYDFDTAIVFWIAASALSFILALFVSKKSHAEEPSD